MKALGIKSAPKQVRYAIVEGNTDGSYTFLNANSENKLSFPSDVADNVEKRLHWLHTELRRIYDHHGPFDKLCVKLSEHTGSDTSDKRSGSYSDAIAFLIAAEKGAPVSTYLYCQLRTKSQEAAARAEARAGRSNTNWNVQMADALLAAIAGLEE